VNKIKELKELHIKINKILEEMEKITVEKGIRFLNELDESEKKRVDELTKELEILIKRMEQEKKKIEQKKEYLNFKYHWLMVLSGVIPLLIIACIFEPFSYSNYLMVIATVVIVIVIIVWLFMMCIIEGELQMKLDYLEKTKTLTTSTYNYILMAFKNGIAIRRCETIDMAIIMMVLKNS